jgi:hypothetical protein
LHALQQDQHQAHAGTPHAHADSPPLDRAALVQALRAMLPLLESSNMQALAAMAAVQAQFGVALGDDLAALDEAIGGLAFEQAVPLCQDLLARCAA